ncbi:FCD domain-containing protein [Paenibacillus sp. CC-CFT747]|nr:FCD domain-containing protein [Paenibacillus sp. CC-CFT747]
MFHNELDNLDEVYAARKLIETEVYLSAAVHAEPQDLQPLHEIIGKLKPLVGDEEPEAFLDELDRFDLHVGGICGNRIYAKLMQTIVYLRRETSLKLLRVPGAMENSLHNRSLLLQALEQGSLEETRKAADAFFEESKEFYKHIGESE